MKIKLILTVLMISIVPAAPILCGIILFGIFMYPTKLPKDKDLIVLFSAHREEFEKLRKMADVDGGRGMIIKAYDSNSKLEKSRQQEYDDIIPKISAGMSVRWEEGGVVKYIIARDGCVISDSWDKGIAYIPGNHERYGTIKHDLDDVGKLGTGTYSRKIEPNWFLFYWFYKE